MNNSLLPKSVEISTDLNTNNWICYDCSMPIEGMHLDVNNGTNISCVCTKCAPTYLERLVARHQFYICDIKEMINKFPKKKSKLKKRNHDVSVDIMNNL